MHSRNLHFHPPLFAHFGFSLFVLLMMSLTSCRDGNFERRGFDSSSERFELQDFDSSLRWKDCPTSTEQSSRICAEVQLSFFIQDRILRSRLDQHSAKLEVKTLDQVSLFNGNEKSDETGEIQIHFDFGFFSEEIKDDHLLELHLSSGPIGEIVYFLRLNFSKSTDPLQETWRKTDQNDEDRTNLNQSVFRVAVMKHLAIQNVESSQGLFETGEASVIFVGQLVDQKSEIPLAHREIFIQIRNPSQGTRVDEKILLDENGGFRLFFSFPRRFYDSEYHQRLDLDFRVESERFPETLSITTVVAPNGAAPVQLVFWQPTLEFEETSYWLWNSSLVLNKESPEINAIDYEISSQSKKLQFNSGLAVFSPSENETRKKNLVNDQLALSAAVVSLRPSDQRFELKRILEEMITISTNSMGRFSIGIEMEKPLQTHEQIYFEIRSKKESYLPSLKFVLNPETQEIIMLDRSPEWR